MTHANGGPKDLSSREAQLTAKEEALKKRESVVAAAESRLGVRACVSIPAVSLHASQAVPCMHALMHVMRRLLAAGLRRPCAPPGFQC